MQSVAEAGLKCLEALGAGRYLPNERKIELYTNQSEILLYNEDPLPQNLWGIPEVAAALASFEALTRHFEGINPGLAGKSPREVFLGLAPASRCDRLAAQVFRMLKIIRLAATAEAGRVKCAERVFQVNYVKAPFSFGLRVTLAGLGLISGFAGLYLKLARMPHPLAYHELMLSEYYADIISEIRYLSDEDGNVLHFRKTCDFCREHRFICSSARYRLIPESVEIEIGERFQDPSRYPIDFYLQIEGNFYIVPCEVLNGNRIAREELAKWRVAEKFAQSGLEYYLRAKNQGLSSSGPMA